MTVRTILSLPAWFVRLATLLLFAIPGIPLIAAHLWLGSYCLERRPSRIFPERTLPQFRPFWLRIYCNEEDGIDGLRDGDLAQFWWQAKTLTWSSRRRIFIWSALRNPVDSLRWVPLLNPRIEPSRVRFIGMDREPDKGESGWYFAWMGVYSCLRVERGGWRFWLGWKIKPEDVKGLLPGDVRAIRCDFAAQLKRIKR